MNIFLWILQILLALHTAAGAVWKFSNSERTVAALRVIPHGAWLGMSAIELLCALGLIAPAFCKPLGIAAPVAALVVAAEMLLLSCLEILSAKPNSGHVVYWLVVAAVCAFVAYGRLALKPS